MKVTETIPFPADSLLGRYVAGDATLAARLGGDPRHEESFRAAAAAVDALKFPRAEIAEVLLPHHERLGADATSLAAVRALADDGTLVVATGQQPGLLTGPLYSILKAATTVALARRLESRLDRRVVPVFWVASDDHDLGEIEGCHVLDADGGVRRFRVALGDVSSPSARLPVPDDASAVVDALLDAVPGGPHLDELRAVAAPRPGDRWPDWFSRVLLRLFEGRGLVLFETAVAADVTRAALTEEATETRRIVEARARGAEQLRALGLEAPLPSDVPSALFHVVDGRRRRLDPAIDDAPRDLSADAGLRPALQSRLLPVIAVVGGPGELAYWLQLTETFEACGVPRPVFVPRSHATLVEPRVRRALESLGLDDADLLAGETAWGPRLDAEDDGALVERLERGAAEAFAGFEAFAADLASTGGRVPRALKELGRTYRASLDKVVRQALVTEREKAGASQRKRTLVAHAGRPRGKDQDRVLNGLPFLARIGIDGFARLADTLDPLEFGHHVVHLDGGDPTHG